MTAHSDTIRLNLVLSVLSTILAITRGDKEVYVLDRTAKQKVGFTLARVGILSHPPPHLRSRHLRSSHICLSFCL